MTLLKLDYKGGKYFILADEAYDLDEGYDYVVGKMTKEDAMRPAFVAGHKEASQYYGIPAYLGRDEELKKLYE